MKERIICCTILGLIAGILFCGCSQPPKEAADRVESSTTETYQKDAAETVVEETVLETDGEAYLPEKDMSSTSVTTDETESTEAVPEEHLPTTEPQHSTQPSGTESAEPTDNTEIVEWIPDENETERT